MDADKLNLFSFLVFSKLEGAVTSGMIHLGDALGLSALACPGGAHDDQPHRRNPS